MIDNYVDDELFVDIACGEKHTIALTFNGDVYGFGCNKHNQLS